MSWIIGRSDNSDSGVAVERKDMCRVYGLPEDEVTYLGQLLGRKPLHDDDEMDYWRVDRLLCAPDRLDDG